MSGITSHSRTRNRFRPVCRALVILALLAGTACSRGPVQWEYSGGTMGTTYNVKVVAPPARAERAELEPEIDNAIRQELDAVDRRMSTYKPDSELSRFNQSRETTPQSASPELLSVFEMAERVSRETDGAFDITIDPVVNAWGFGPEKRPDTAPAEAELEALRARVGYTLLTLDHEASTIQKTNPEVYCDLSAIAKGYGVDRVATALEALGLERYMVEVGGEVRVRGHNAKGTPWHIGIERPNVEGRLVYRAIPLADGGMATSGDYRNYFEENGTRYSHEIDPKTLRPIGHQLASVTVLHPECALADAYATAFMVMGPEKAYQKAVDLGLAAFFIVYGEGETYIDKATPEFERIENTEPPA